MYVVASFEYSDGLEIAIKELENLGIEKKKILVMPLDKRVENNKLFDSMSHSDGKSLIDFSAILGTILMLLGGIYGFLVKWGPIFTALIGLICGLIIGFIFDLIYSKAKQKRKINHSTRTEVFVMINCSNDQEDKIRNILWSQFAIGIATLRN